MSLVPEPHVPKWVSWELLPRGWFKLNFDGSVRGNRASNDIGAFVEAGSVPIANVSVQKTEIRRL